LINLIYKVQYVLRKNMTQILIDFAKRQRYIDTT
jgi:hypothetical protein